MSIRKELKGKLAKLKMFKSNLPRLIDCSEVNGDGFYNKEMLERVEKDIKTLEEILAASNPQGNLLRVRQTPEQIFVDAVKKYITNMLINNPNYDNNYYDNKNTWDVIRDTKNRATHILEEIDRIKHLVLMTDEDFEKLELLKQGNPVFISSKNKENEQI